MGKSCWMASLKCNVHKVLYGRWIERAMVACPPHKTYQLHILLHKLHILCAYIRAGMTQGCMA